MIFLPGESWRKKAKCATVPRTSFFPVGRSSSKEALAACAQCEVVEQCLKYALENNITHGIWGGKTESQRKRMVA
jgi:WhiB family redox-sensing transcriptional regulator